MTNTYQETFDAGTGGWYAWDSNYAGDKPLEIVDGSAVSRSPWWIDYNHAPPGAGYMHLLFMLDTLGRPTERKIEIAGHNNFVRQGHSTNFVDAELTFRLKGELVLHDAQLVLYARAFTTACVRGGC
ncbi:MAG: hypothetical protein CM1200mP2_16910 [Planctomycetaceae bacterium]|nr:MAG: hypothetical protein CM1200mP2_16910 [Planctomycetaceae bacterium]